MPILTLTFDTGSVPLATVVNAIGATYGYSATLPDGTTNPETAAVFAKRMVGQHIIELVHNRQIADAAATINSITLT